MFKLEINLQANRNNIVMSGIVLPVVAGLSIGFLTIIIFTILFSHPHLSIEGLRESYRVGEPIAFTLRVSGFGYYCQAPNAWITNSSSVFTSIPDWQSGLPPPLCPPYPQSQFIDDKYSWGEDRAATIEKNGSYVLGARLGSDPAVRKEFVVVSSDSGMSVTSEQVPDGAIIEVNITDSDVDNAPDVNVPREISNTRLPVFSNEYMQHLKDIALEVPELSQWSSDEWQALDVAFKGVTEPEQKWTHAIVYLELSPDANAPKDCEFGWAATVIINLENMQVEQVMAPSEENAECGFEFGGPIMENGAFE